MLRQTVTRVRTFLQRYESILASGALVVGFVIDNLVFTRVDILWNNLILIAYIVLAGGGIALWHASEEHGFVNRTLQTVAAAMPIVVQYAFGSLFSGLIVFYSRSASFAISWVFVVVLVAFLLFSERFSHNYRRFRYQMVLLFFLLLTFNWFFIPVIIGHIGRLVFIGSAIVSFFLMIGYILLLRKFVPRRVSESFQFLIRAIAGVLIVFLGLYAINAIPPLPLSLEEGEVAHAVHRVADSYTVSHEIKPWYLFWERYNTVYHKGMGEPVYVFTSVFIPTKLSLSLEHEWQYYNEASKSWVTTNTVTFPVVGGRDGGYRGYTMKSNVEKGKWRVNVRTNYGAIVGRVDFIVENTDVSPALEEVSY